MGNNKNHPAKGSKITVLPITDPKAIERIKGLLNNKPRDLACFCTGVSFCLRGGDLLSLKIGQVKSLSIGDTLVLTEKKTTKTRSITINRTAYHAIQNLLTTKEMKRAPDSAFLFQSRKTRGRLEVSTLTRLVKLWTREVGLKGNYGSHSLRKTFGYMHRTQFNTDLLVLQKIYRHSSPAQTLDYLCIQPEEIRDAYMKEI